MVITAKRKQTRSTDILFKRIQVKIAIAFKAMKVEDAIMAAVEADYSEEDGLSMHSPSTRTSHTQAEMEQRREELAARETKAVGKLKVLVFGILFLSMVAVALTTYFITSKAEQENFEAQYYDDANKILGNMGR